MSNARKILSGVVGGVTLIAVNIVVSFFQFKILVRNLPIEVVGIWMVFVSIGGYFLSFDLGISTTLGREISFAAADLTLDQKVRAQRIGTLFKSVTITAIGLAIVFFIIGSSVGWSYLRTIIPSLLVVHMRNAWYIFLGGAVLNLIGEGWLAGIYGFGQVLREKIVRMLSAFFGLLFISCAAVANSFIGLAFAYLLQAGITITLAGYALSRAGSKKMSNGIFELSTLRRLFAPSLKYAATVLGGMLVLQTDNLIIASTLGAIRIPNYQAVAKIVSILLQLSMMLVLTNLPLTSQAHARKDRPQLLALLNRNLRYSLSVFVVLGSFVACFADRLVFMWLGAEHFVGFVIVWVLLGAMLLEVHQQCLAVATMATGKIAFATPALLSGLLKIILSVLLAHRFGLLGIVLGTLLAQVATNYWYAPWYTLRYFEIAFSEHFRTVLRPISLLLIVTIGSNIGIRHLSTGISSYWSVAIGVLCTIILGPLFFSAIALTSNEKVFLYRKLQAINEIRLTST